MYVRLAALAAALLWATASYAQEKTFMLTVTSQDLQALSAGLDELPRKISEPIIQKFQKQLIPQMQPAPTAPPSPTAQVDAPSASLPSANPHPSF